MHTSVLDQDMDRILISADELDRITTEIAARIDTDYSGMEGKLVLLPCRAIWQGPLNLRMCKFCQPATLPVSIWLRKYMHTCTRKHV